MEERICRNVPALTEEECARLGESRVLIAGCGGLGGYLAELLLRAGVGRLRVCDGDVFEPSNLNRQLLAEVPLLGENKAQAAAARAKRIAPEAAVEVWDRNLTRENVRELVAGCDGVLDALDNIPDRKTLAQACTEAGIPYFYGAIGGWVAQAAVVLPGDSLLQSLYPEGTAVQDSGVVSVTAALCASVQAALCIQLLAGRPVQGGKLHCFDLLNQEFETLSLG